VRAAQARRRETGEVMRFMKRRQWKLRRA